MDDKDSRVFVVLKLLHASFPNLYNCIKVRFFSCFPSISWKWSRALSRIIKIKVREKKDFMALLKLPLSLRAREKKNKSNTFQHEGKKERMGGQIARVEFCLKQLGRRFLLRLSRFQIIENYGVDFANCYAVPGEGTTCSFLCRFTSFFCT